MPTSIAIRKRERTKRHKRGKFVKAVTDPMSDTFLDKQGAAIVAGYSPTSANSIFKDSQTAIVKALDKLGLTDEYMAEQLKTFFGERDRLCLDALQFLAKLRGNYAPEKRLTASLNVSLLSDEELHKYAGTEVKEGSPVGFTD